MTNQADDAVMVVVTQFFHVTGVVNPARFQDSAEHVMGELVKLSEIDPAVLDSAVSSDAGRDTVEIEVTVSAVDVEDGIGKATTATRTAIHAAGGGTPAWPSQHEAIQLVTTKVTGHLVDDETDDTDETVGV